MIGDSIKSIGTRKRYFVFLLWHIVHLTLHSSSANCFASSTTASTAPRYRHQRHNGVDGRFPPVQTSSTVLQMVASTPPRGGSTGNILPQPATPSTSTGTDDNSNSNRWTKIRQTVFPIHGKHEVTKFLLIGAIKFFIILALTLTRDTKDTLVVTQCGAEAIAFLKVRNVKRKTNGWWIFL